MSKGRERLVNLTVLAVTCLLVLGALEIGLRISGLDGRPPPPRRVDVYDGARWKTLALWGTSGLKREATFEGNTGGGEYQPNLVFRFVYSDPDGFDDEGAPRWHRTAVLHRTNALGLRGADVPGPKTAARKRVLMLGDSFTFGDGVPDDDTFSAQLSSRANGWEAINAGVSGYNTADEVAYLEHRGLALQPDIVLIVFYLNDAYDDERFGALIMGGAEGLDVTRKPSDSALYSVRLVTNILARTRASQRTMELYRAQFSDAPIIDGHDWGDSKAALLRARDLCTANGARLGLVIFPELHQLDDAHPFTFIHKEVAEFARGAEIPVLDLLDAFRGEDPASLWVHLSDHHPNKRAHGIAAGAIDEFLTDPIHEFGSPVSRD